MVVVTVKDVRVICTVSRGISPPAVRVDINVPGLCSLGCETFSYRYLTVELVVKEYLTLLLKGRSTGNIGELWQL